LVDSFGDTYSERFWGKIVVGRNKSCPCGSGKRYKACCGKAGKVDEKYWLENAPGRFPYSLSDPRLAYLVEREPVCEWSGEKMPAGVLVKDIGDEYNWRELADKLVQRSDGRVAGVMSKSRERKTSQVRVTTIVDQAELAGPVQALIKRLYLEQVEPFYKKQLRWFQQPQVLRYSPGGFYRPHADSDQLSSAMKWERVNDRHLSLLFYLDDDYTGGDLTFPNFSYRLRPRAGMLIAFPADGRYLHAAAPVESGVRHAIVSWSSVFGGELVGNTPPQDAIFVNR
jgi:predicted 2-oxoglutarate/Fe(II)-dependent dioxygenase YbiX